MTLKKTATLIAAAAAAALALAGCASAGGADETAESESAASSEQAVERTAAVSTICTTEGGAEFTIIDFETSWNFSSPGDSIADCSSEVLTDGTLTEEQAAAAEALGQPDDIEAVAPLYAVCAHPEFGGIDPAAASDEETAELQAAVQLCPEHPLAAEVEAR
ncbi:hypothetical protein [Agrococcus casei]|uniref:DUF732 domain-containing protein n=1 Tax=Agrococcus casei LMG 22410 TaxID=1255656 RepID=A0A1R4FDV2_9MICO|nr:hypothetical protein [Agrococcus casei]SJM54056.1 hypothetical protein CZ674_04070 [Agrococcus casei LMG 22410]